MSGPRIHPTAIVSPGAELDSTVEVGPYAVIGPEVRIGAHSTVGPHAVLQGRTTLGARNRVFQFASVGAIPQDLKYAGEATALEIGDGNQIREFTTLHIGTAGGGGVTRIGDQNLFMAYSHVAHDARVGNGCVFANGATLAGHVEIGDHAILGGLSAVHQFTRVGSHAFVAGGSMVVMDVPPYCIVQGDRAELAGLNTIGLQRHGFSEEAQTRLKESYRVLFRSKLPLEEAVARLRVDYGGHREVEVLLDFVTTSTRGLTR
ncbi:MAG TPA: acyl-ACP--UDP-N-acetylglucosamine O-acyltransferase [Myxococcaceae bacterium]|jgi:UDP-N-acetylglucosamine acyltransferase|nr:acyl-ACP--UDP-N-acetylglucosamine O-acyltransferase [Myxococcaceae bacterium]